MTFTDIGKRRKLVVIHEDDVGMTHGSNTAFTELSGLGTCSSGSVMVPCPWFPEAVDFATATPSLDLGVHLTLTSEKRPYRWRPVTTPPRSAGLTNDMGYFWPDVPSARRAAPEVVEAELRAQVDIALAMKIDVTHLDAHMGTALCPEFVDIYLRLGQDYRLPILLPRDYNTFNPRSYSGPMSNERYDAALAQAKTAGFPIFEAVFETPLGRTVASETAYEAMFRTIPEGLTFLSMHFNAPGDFEVIEPAQAHIRTEEFALFKTGKIAEWTEQFGLEIIGMRALRDALELR